MVLPHSSTQKYLFTLGGQFAAARGGQYDRLLQPDFIFEIMKSNYLLSRIILFIFAIFLSLQLQAQSKSVKRVISAFESKNWMELNELVLKLKDVDSNSSNYFFAQALNHSEFLNPRYNEEIKLKYYKLFFQNLNKFIHSYTL